MCKAKQDGTGDIEYELELDIQDWDMRLGHAKGGHRPRQVEAKS